MEKPSLFKVFYRPAEEFQKLRENPRILLPLVLILLINAVLSVIQAYALFDNPYFLKIVEEQMALVPMEMETYKMITIIGAPVGMVFGNLILLLMTAFLFWIFSVLFQGEATYKQMFSLSIYIMPIFILGSIIQFLPVYFFKLDPTIPITSLAGIISAEGVLKAFLGSIEIFTIWTSVLVAIGMKEVAQLPEKKARIAGGLYFVITFIFTFANLLLGGGM